MATHVATTLPHPVQTERSLQLIGPTALVGNASLDASQQPEKDRKFSDAEFGEVLDERQRDLKARAAGWRRCR
jgi:hypothetical protein